MVRSIEFSPFSLSALASAVCTTRSRYGHLRLRDRQRPWSGRCADEPAWRTWLSRGWSCDDMPQDHAASARRGSGPLADGERLSGVAMSWPGRPRRVWLSCRTSAIQKASRKKSKALSASNLPGFGHPDLAGAPWLSFADPWAMRLFKTLPVLVNPAAQLLLAGRLSRDQRAPSQKPSAPSPSLSLLRTHFKAAPH